MNGALSWSQCSDGRMPMPVSRGRGPAAIHFALPDRALKSLPRQSRLAAWLCVQGHFSPNKGTTHQAGSEVTTGEFWANVSREELKQRLCGSLFPPDVPCYYPATRP